MTLCAGLALWGVETTVAQTGSRQTAEAKFVERQPGVPTALRFSVDYVNPEDPDAKPPAVRKVVERLAQGAAFDTSVPARCTASDAQLLGQGEGACPLASKVGTGYIRIDTGFPEPNRFLEEDVAFLNNENELIFLTTDRATGVRFVSRATVEGGTITSSAPPLPGTPPDGGAIAVVRTRLDEVSRTIDGEVRGYMTTPHRCPRGGAWLNSLSFTYADGVTQDVASPSPCVGRRSRKCTSRWEGTRGSDRHAGTSRCDRLFGYGGQDRLRGRGGADRLYGGRGADVLRGGRGQDRLNGGPGRDTCRGGRGHDRLRGCERIGRR